jgi:hypothetical protein
VILTDEPMLSMYETAVDEAPAALKTARA